MLMLVFGVVAHTYFYIYLVFFIFFLILFVNCSHKIRNGILSGVTVICY